MDEAVRFVARLRDGEKMGTLRAAFAISRKTGYPVLHPPAALCAHSVPIQQRPRLLVAVTN